MRCPPDPVAGAKAGCSQRWLPTRAPWLCVAGALGSAIRHGVGAARPSIGDDRTPAP